MSHTTTINIEDTSGETFSVTLRLEEMKGRLEVKSFTIDADNPTGVVTAALFRNLPLTEAILTARANHGSTDVEELAPLTVQKWRATEEQLSLVASLYREAYKQGKPVQNYLSSKVGRPLPTVNRWVSIAREKGYLGSAKGTRAGEE